MGIPAAVTPLLLGQSRYLVPRSLRSRVNVHLTRTFSTATGSTTHWVSMWIKRGQLNPGTTQVLWGAADASTRYDIAYFFNDRLSIIHNVSATDFGVLTTSQLFRDTSAWYHIYYVHDSRDATAANRMRLWVNGVEVTSFSTRTNIATQNSTLASWLTSTSDPHDIGRNPRGGLGAYDGLFAEFVAGQGGNPPAVGTFGRFNPATGAWVPRKIGSGTAVFGTTGNGFYLPFSNPSSLSTLAADASGNGRNFTSNHFLTGVANDSFLDTPTENFCTLSPEQPALDGVIGNLATVWNNLSWATSASSWVLSSGKWFYEVEAGVLASSPTQSIAFGWARSTTNNFPGGYYAGSAANGYGAAVSSVNVLPYSDAIALTASQITGSYAAGAKFRSAIDFDAGRLWLGTASAWCGGGNPEAGTSPTYTFTPGFPMVPVLSAYNTLSYINCGQQPWQTTKPAGFNPISSRYLPNPVIARGDNRFGILTYTGDDVTPKTRAGLRFQPDLVWIKMRNDNINHTIWDSVRGAGSTKGLSSNGTDGEGLGSSLGGTASNGFVSAFNSDGFSTTTGTVTDLYVNDTGKTYVAWAWDRDPLVNGVDIVTYTGNGATSRTISHGLNAVPEMIIIKSLAIAGWIVYHFGANATPQNGALFLELPDAYFANSAYWNNTAPTTSAFTIGNNGRVNSNGVSYVAYVFRSVPGFSSMGWFQGNGSTNGPYIPLSFRPRYVLFKSATVSANWFIRDTARNPFNVMPDSLLPNLNNLEAPGVEVDFCSNGFKPRSAGSGLNGNGEITVFAAFAETPFKHANAR